MISFHKRLSDSIHISLNIGKTCNFNLELKKLTIEEYSGNRIQKNNIKYEFHLILL